MNSASTLTALEPQACYPALLARDARFDGRFFVGVTSTGIYCRPICRVRTPKLANCRFFASAAQAEAEAFRPCLKCRPELAPGGDGETWTVMDASRILARQAAALLDAGEEASVAEVAARMGVSDRHLRRIFMAEHGVTPLQYLQTRRLLLAKQLLTDSTLPVSEIAFAAGFASLRRFNAAFLEHYRLQPTALRKEGKEGRGAERGSVLRLVYRAPYDVDGVLNFLLPRAVAGVERVEVANALVERTVRLRHAGAWHRGWFSARFAEPGKVEITLSSSLWPAVGSLLPLVRRWLDLDADPDAIAAALGEGAISGQRLPGCVDRFELAVRAVLGQQVTVAAARTLGGRFVERFGEVIEGAPAGATHTFPRPEVIAGAPVERIAELGIIRQRAEALRALAKAWPTLAFAQASLLSRSAIDAALTELQALPGIGPWTAYYMLMRGWSWPDAFPPGDVALKKALEKVSGGNLSPKAYLAAAEKYRPYRSYAVLHLWRTLA
ncbi:MAG TPA: Ada metal-binding domain-containing protein [Burkholderiaceae bacterium]|jgi:AraC family transcriptional regulator of adaptative response / DNA-3-methyladenine glycosylase II